MTDREHIEKATNHAKRLGIAVDLLNNPKVSEAVVPNRRVFKAVSVSFQGEGPSKAVFYLDSDTGEVISGELSGPEFAPKLTGKQFSKRAQRTLALASKVSKRMGCEHVGSDHLLLGVMLSRNATAEAVLSRAGLSIDAVRARIRDAASAPEVAPTGYGPSMRNVLRLTSHYADVSCDGEIEPEHLLLGLFDETDGPALRLFQHFGLDVGQSKAALVQKLSQEAAEP